MREQDMVRFINKVTGSEMWVAKDRAEEYRSAGHKSAEADHTSENRPKTKKPARKTKK